jgi:hypothetical protein
MNVIKDIYNEIEGDFIEEVNKDIGLEAAMKVVVLRMMDGRYAVCQSEMKMPVEEFIEKRLQPLAELLSLKAKELKKIISLEKKGEIRNKFKRLIDNGMGKENAIQRILFEDFTDMPGDWRDEAIELFN